MHKINKIFCKKSLNLNFLFFPLFVKFTNYQIIISNICTVFAFK